MEVFNFDQIFNNSWWQTDDGNCETFDIAYNASDFYTTKDRYQTQYIWSWKMNADSHVPGLKSSEKNVE